MEMNDGFCMNILDSLYEGAYILDRNRKITYWNKGAERITGFSSAEVVGKCCGDNILTHINGEGANICREICPVAETIAQGIVHEDELYLHHKYGSRVPVSVRVTPMRNSKGEITGAVEVFTDRSARSEEIQRIRELEKMAFIDPLTKVANRHYIETNLRARLDEMRRYGWTFGVLFIDLDNFKRINDEHGHDIGDKVLKMVARTLAGNSRPSDLIGRWGGEEFVAVIVNINKDQLYSIADKFRLLIEKSFIFTGPTIVRVTVSIGAALARPKERMNTLLKRADKLMYHSKASGRNRVSVDSGK